jgi:hypothetical protein
MEKKTSNLVYESKTLKKAVSEAVKSTSYHLKGTHVAKTVGVNSAKKVITLKK